MTTPDIKLVTISWTEEDGLEVDWEGMNEYEAWSYLTWGLDMVQERIYGEDE